MSDLPAGARDRLLPRVLAAADRLRRGQEGPVDVVAICRSLGVRVEWSVSKGTSEAGYGRSPEGPKIVVFVVPTRRSPARERFSIAHELGHHVLDEVVADRTTHRDLVAERLCDDFAGRLLVPPDEITAAGGAGGDLRDLALLVPQLADACDVSLLVAATQLLLRHGGGCVAVSTRQGSFKQSRADDTTPTSLLAWAARQLGATNAPEWAGRREGHPIVARRLGQATHPMLCLVGPLNPDT